MMVTLICCSMNLHADFWKELEKFSKQVEKVENDINEFAERNGLECLLWDDESFDMQFKNDMYSMLSSSIYTNSRVSNIGYSLLKNSARSGSDIDFYVQNSSDIQAYCYAGGIVTVTSACLDLPDNEIAGMLAHELGHASYYHFVRKVQHQELYKNLINKGVKSIKPKDSREIWRLVCTELYNIPRMGYSRECEKEADLYAINLLSKTGYNPNGLIDFFSNHFAADYEQNYLDSHPPISVRIDYMKNYIYSYYNNYYRDN